MKTYITSRLMEHPPGAPCPVPPDTPIWVLLAGNTGVFCDRAKNVDWENADDIVEGVVLAWAPVVETAVPRTAHTGMVKGHNVLSLSPASMYAVLQAWLDDEIASPVEVVSVDYNHQNGTGQFIVRFKRKDEGIPT